MKRILLATDLSGRSDRAGARAAALARQLGAELRLICALDDEMPERARRALAQEAEAALSESVAAARAKGVAADCAVTPGRPHAAILRAAEDFAADLIVLGAHRHEPLADFFVGSTVERVVRYARPPVLVVRDLPKGPYARVLVGVDFSPSAERALRAALDVAPEARIEAANAFETPFPGFLPRAAYADEMRREREAELSAFLARACGPERAPTVVPRVVEGEATAAIRNAVEDSRPDLLALGAHARSGFAHAVLGSTVELFLRRLPCDLLAARA